MTDSIPVQDVESIKKQEQLPLYMNRNRVYPRRVSGPYRSVKWWVLAVTLTAYYIGPWLRWDRGPGAPDQALLIDMPNRRAYFFFLEIWPQEVYYLAGLLILGAIGLFLVTSLMGRVWCGYTCPQTVWTDLFMWVERRIEGDRNTRMKLDRAPFGLSKAAKKVAKHGAWLAISLVTGGAWIMYFRDAPTVVGEFFTGQASLNVYFFTGLFTATTYLLAGWAREQVCTYMCPWPRFQAAMFDEHSLIVTYEAWRGEPRGKHKQGADRDGRGDCVDCNWCVAVCPTGIDIRDGQQLECIGCGLCIDACNPVMDKLGLPRGLIRLDTTSKQAARAEGRTAPLKLVRPRTVVYGALLVIVAGIMAWSLLTRAKLEVNVLHDRSPLFVALSDGGVRNGYTFKILNMNPTPRSYRLTLEGLEAATMSIVGVAEAGARAATLIAPPDQVATYRVLVVAPPGSLGAPSTPLTFALTDQQTGEQAVNNTVFRGPER